MSDRAMTTCDRCPAAHAVEWWKAEGRATLLTCQHHGREHGPALVAAGFLALNRLEDAAGLVEADA